MKTRNKSLLILLLVSTASIPTHGEVILEAAWVDITSVASASNGGQGEENDLAGRAGLGVIVQRSVSANVAGASASASTTANATFDGTSLFTATLGLNLFTSAGIYPVAFVSSIFFVDFRVEGQSENAPIWSPNTSSFSSTTNQFGGQTLLYPTFRIENRNGQPMAWPLTPGSYRATAFISLMDSQYPDGGTTVGTTTFSLLFGSASIGPGFNQANPIMPQPSTPGEFTFINAPSGRWFDPPSTEGFTFQTTDGSKFTDILNLPSGFGSDFNVVVDGQVLGTFGAGDSVNFKSLLGEDVSKFQILGISPTVASQDPLAFPIQLAFTTPIASFTMTPVPPIPKLVAVSVQASLGSQPPKFSGTLMNGPSLGTARLQASLDLGTTDPWSDLTSVTLDAEGSVTFTNIPDSRSQALGAHSDYFRVVTEFP